MKRKGNLIENPHQFLFSIRFWEEELVMDGMKKRSIRIERVRKPRKCPECGQAPLATILYGLPALSEDLARKMREGRITLGGCCISGDDPAWECPHCGCKIFRRRV